MLFWMKWRKNMNVETAKETAMSIINNNNYALIGTISLNEYPNIKALTKMKNEELKVFYFSTNIISTKVEQIKHNNKGCVYFFDPIRYIGVMLEGKFEITDDSDFNGLEGYRPEGLSSSDYCTLRFNVKTGRLKAPLFFNARIKVYHFFW